MKKSILIITLFLLALTLTPALAQAPEGEEYIVQAGDSLSKIAAREYGNPQAFLSIVEATNAKAAEDDSFAVINSSGVILMGQKLWLPADPDLTGPAAPAPGERVTAAIELTTNPWLWQSFTDPVQAFEVDNPENYSISFNTEGMVNVQADCNIANGTYTADDNGSLSIEIGPTTLAACPPDSRSDEFIQKLGFVSNFFFENGVLYLDTMADGGTFQLASASEHMPAAPPTQDPDLAPAQESGLPPAPITNDEGGPKRLVGNFDYANFAFLLVAEDPSMALIDMVHTVQEGPTPTQFAPVESQILGYLTSPISPPPLSYAFNLPAEPIATLLDVDNDGEEDTGVQIFRLVLAPNINGGSYLEQLDQGGPLSYLTDPLSGQMTEGSLLVYAPDDQQGFPGGFGPDGLLFTEDDPAVGLPQGYTVVHFGPDSFTFDRSAEAEMNLLEPPEGASPDFSDQGVVESFNSLIDHLAVRYSFTEFRELDWEAIRAEYLPQVEEAEQTVVDDPDLGGGMYVATLHNLAQSIHDAHVQAVILDVAYIEAAKVARQLKTQPIATNVGANTVELSDGKIIVTDVISDSPAAEAGWTLGTEIVAVNGEAVDERLPTVIYNDPTGTDEGQRLFQVNNLLKFPAPEEDSSAADVTIEAILPGDSEAQSFTMTPGDYSLPNRVASPPRPFSSFYRMTPAGEDSAGWGYVSWDGFLDPVLRMSMFEKFLEKVQQASSLDGIIIDMRGNGGGWEALYFTMASYFFNADNPVSMHWTDQDVYDLDAGGFVRSLSSEFLLSAPRPDLYYDGPIVVLVDQHCASSCEFFSQFLQTTDRATVVAQHASEGAGAPIDRVSLPFGIVFQYTKSRSYFAGTDELNLEAKGVVPDVRVPITLESVEAVLQGEDPVLEAGLRELQTMAEQDEGN